MIYFSFKDSAFSLSGSLSVIFYFSLSFLIGSAVIFYPNLRASTSFWMVLTLVMESTV